MFAITLWNVNMQTCIAFRFAIDKGCQWQNCTRATGESIIYHKWMRDPAPSQIKKRFRPQRARSSLLQHWLKCCVHLHLERHIKFAPMSDLVVLGWAQEKSDFWVGHYHKLTFTPSLDGRSFHWHCFIMLFMVPFGWYCLFIEHYVGPVGKPVDKPHIAIVFASWHLQVNTGSDLILGSITFFLSCSVFSWCFHFPLLSSFGKINN